MLPDVLCWQIGTVHGSSDWKTGSFRAFEVQNGLSERLQPKNSPKTRLSDP